MIKRITRLTVLITLSLFALDVCATEMPEKPDKAVQTVEEVMAVTHPCARMSGSRLDKRASPFQAAIDEYAAKYQVDSSIIKAVIAIESCYNERAESPMGAQGLMQLIPATAERFGVTDSFDSSQNIHGGTRYLNWLLKRYKGDLVKVFAAYNAGEGKVDRYGGVPPYNETRHYVHNVMTVYRKLSGDESTDPTADVADVAEEVDVQLAKAAISLPVTVVQALARPAIVPAVAASVRSASVRHQQAGFVIGGPGVPVKPPTSIMTGAPAADASSTADVGTSIMMGAPAADARDPMAVDAGASIMAGAPASASAMRVASRPAQPAKRVNAIFESPFKKLSPSKPGRAGWQANKAMAPQLYKH